MASLTAILQARMTDDVYRGKLFHSLCCFFCFIAVGMGVSQTGPALLDLQLITNTNTEQASLFITSASAGSMIGSLSIGLIYKRWNKPLLMACLSLSTSITVIALPWSSSFGLMIFMQAVVAMFMSALSGVIMVDVIRTWAPNSRVYAQILNTCFSVGGAVSPLITQPFLAPRTSESQNSSSLGPASPICIEGPNDREVVNNSIFDNSTSCVESQGTHIQFAYLIPGLWFLVGSFLFIADRIHSRQGEDTVSLHGQYESLDIPLPKPILITTMFTLFLMFFFYVSVQTALASYLLTFGVMYLNWSKPEGANLTTDFWLCHASGRFLTIFFTKFISPYKVLLLSSCIMFLATLGNVFCSLRQYDIGVWICTGITGLCVSSQVPSLMMWTEESVRRLTPGMMSVFNLSITLPGMVLPQILGYLMQEVSPLWLFFVTLVLCGVLLALLLLSYIWVKLVVQTKHKHLNRTKTMTGDVTDADADKH